MLLPICTSIRYNVDQLLVKVDKRFKNLFARDAMALEQGVPEAISNAAGNVQNPFVEVTVDASGSLSLMGSHSKRVNLTKPVTYSEHSANCVPQWGIARSAISSGRVPMKGASQYSASVLHVAPDPYGYCGLR